MTDDDLAHAFAELSRQVPEPWELTGVTYHGRDRGWVAFVYNNATYEFGPEGVGGTAFEALADLRPQLSELQ